MTALLSCRQGFELVPDAGEPVWFLPDGGEASEGDPPEMPTCDLPLDQGTCDGTIWNQNSGWLELDGVQTGSYTSPICDAGEVVDWLSLGVAARMPYGKPLSHQSDSGYPEGNLSVEGMVALWHLDGPLGVIAPGSTVPNALPGRTGGLTQDLDGTMAHVPARFGQGIYFDGIDDLVVMQDREDFNFGYDDFSLAAWVKTTMDCGHWCGFLGRQVRADGGITLEMNSQDQGNFFLGYLTREYDNIEGGKLINDDQWHFLAGVKQGNTGTLYVDGQEIARADPIKYPRSFDSIHDFEIGGYSDTPQIIRAVATIDEVTVWKKALDAETIRHLYWRGSLRYRIQVRSCDDPRCSGEQFVGPDNTPDTWFTENKNPDNSPPSFDLRSLDDGRYFQYRLVLESDEPDQSPLLESVILITQ